MNKAPNSINSGERRDMSNYIKMSGERFPANEEWQGQGFYR